MINPNGQPDHVCRKAAPKRRLLVIDDHPVVCAGLASLINGQPDLLCCGQAANGAAAEQALAALQPDLVLLDLHLGNENGLALTEAWCRRFTGLRVLILSMADERRHAQPALRAGAMGYVMKEMACQELLAAIRTVLAGQVYLSPGLRQPPRWGCDSKHWSGGS